MREIPCKEVFAIKKNRMQLLSLLMSVILLVLLIWQSWAVADLRRSLRNAEDQIYDLENEVQEISSDVARAVEEAANPIQDWEVHPSGINQEQKQLLADAILKLKSWPEDTVVYLETVVGPDKHVTAMQVDDLGSCSGTMMFPVNEQYEVRLAAVVTGGGESRRVDLGGWTDISMLLPLQLCGSSVGGPTYQEGVLSSDFDLSLRNESGVEVLDPVFRIYRNGTLEHEAEAELSESASVGDRDLTYVPALPDQTLGVECVPGDRIEVRFSCTDGYGLGYDFPYLSWTIPEDGSKPEGGRFEGNESLPGPELTWPA